MIGHALEKELLGYEGFDTKEGLGRQDNMVDYRKYSSDLTYD